MIDRFIAFLVSLLKWNQPKSMEQPEVKVPTQSETPPVEPPVAPQALSFETPKQAYHSTRVICDEMGLPMVKAILVNGKLFSKKDILCACVFQESRFLTNPKPNTNKDPKTGKVWSTDYGIVQVNDYYHIGPGKEFKSVDEAVNDPEKGIRWMVGVYVATGALQPWSSYTKGAYKQHLSPTSEMWELAKP